MLGDYQPCGEVGLEILYRVDGHGFGHTLGRDQLVDRLDDLLDVEQGVFGGMCGWGDRSTCEGSMNAAN